MSSRRDDLPPMARMPWYPRDYASSTHGWADCADLAYRRLLDASWDMGGLPAEPATLRRIARMDPGPWRTAWRYLESKFPVGHDGLRRNPRLEQHRQEAVNQYLSRRRGAEKTNRKRWRS